MEILAQQPQNYNALPSFETQQMLDRSTLHWREFDPVYDHSDTDLYYPLTNAQEEVFERLNAISDKFSQAFFYLIRGFYVYPLGTKYGWQDATNDFDRLAEMYLEFPNAEPAWALGTKYGYVAIRLRDLGAVSDADYACLTLNGCRVTANSIDTWQCLMFQPRWKEREEYTDKMSTRFVKAIKNGNAKRAEQILTRHKVKRSEIGEDESWLIFRLDLDFRQPLPSFNGFMADGSFIPSSASLLFGESLLKDDNLPPMRLPDFILDSILQQISSVSSNGNTDDGFTSEPSRRSQLDKMELDTTVVEEFNDIGNARRFVRQHGNDLLYIVERKNWVVWDNRRWTPDRSMEVQYRAKRTARSIAYEASIAGDDKYDSLLKHAQRTKHARAIRDMLSMAESDLAISESAFDHDLMLLNCRNGTIDLRTGELKKHDRSNRITKLANASYDKYAKCPAWNAFLVRITNNNHNLISFLQRAVGYSLTGLVNERAVFVQHGSGANGKSVFTETILHVMGDYSAVAPSSAVMRKQNNAATNDLAKLHGARFVSVNETDEGSYLNESTIKAISGNDTVTARFLYGEYFDFIPRFKLWLRTNHKPTVRGIDEGIWDRLKLIPFIVRIPKHEQDKNLIEKLKSEGNGILAWAVEGCLEWQHNGLGVPLDVEQATDAYRKEQDVFAQFVDLCCVLSPNAWTSTGELNHLYESFCRERNQQSNLRGNMMAERLRELGCSPKNTRKGRGWEGIGLLAPQWSDRNVDSDDSVDTDFMN